MNRSFIHSLLAPFFEFCCRLIARAFSSDFHLGRISIKMVFVVVQWKEENSVSVISEKQVVLGANHELKEGLTVVVSTGKNSKGRIAVYKAVVLKVFGEWDSYYYLT